LGNRILSAEVLNKVKSRTFAEFTLLAIAKPEAIRGTYMNESTEIELQAAAFRRLVAHLDENKQVQNIDLMNLAGFCRNCLSKWYRAAAEDKGIEMDYEEAREIIYGMPYAEWKEKFQTPASPEQLAKFDAADKT
jgi:hypothetical protein